MSDFYSTDKATFDIRETDNEKWAVIRVPDLTQNTVGAGKFLATFDTMEDAHNFCDKWEQEK